MVVRNELNRDLLREAIIALTIQAGFVVWDHFNAGVAVEFKGDTSPVTLADRAGEAVIIAGLQKLAPHIPVVAEEEASAGRIPDISGIFFLVDPLDGTKEFINRGTDFTVNIGLIEDGEPTMGVVYAPALSRLFWGDTEAGEAWQAHQPPHGERSNPRRISVRQLTGSLCAVASKSHNTAATESWLTAAGVVERVSIGSSLKFVLVASGEADVYPRPAPTMEWDTAAGDAVLRAAGGRVFDLDGAVLGYGKPRFFNPGFVATGPYQPEPLRQFLTGES